MKGIDVINLLNREIQINTLTPDVANKVDSYIRFWNMMDEELLDSEKKPIKIYINSFGGSLMAALTLVDSIKLSRIQVYTINRGIVAKEAFYVYLAGIRRYSYPRSSFYFEKNLQYFNTGETQSNYEDFISGQQQELKDMVLERTKITDSEFEKRDGWWLTAEKAYSYHICNEVIRAQHIN